MFRRHATRFTLRLMVMVLLWSSVVAQPAIALACDVEDAHYELAALLNIDLAPDPDPELDRLVHCCGHSAPLLATPILLVPRLMPGTLPIDVYQLPLELPVLPPRRPPRQG